MAEALTVNIVANEVLAPGTAIEVTSSDRGDVV